MDVTPACDTEHMSNTATVDRADEKEPEASAHWVDIIQYKSGRAKARCMDCAAVWPTRTDWTTAHADAHAHEVTTGNEHHMCDCGDHAERPPNQQAIQRRTEFLPPPDALARLLKILQ